MGNFDRRWRFDSILKMEATVCLSLILAVITFATPALTSEPRVVCYYTNWSVYRPGTARFNPQNINPYLCTHLIYAFGGFTKDNTLKPFDKYQDIEKGGYAKFTGLKTYNKNLKTLLAIGGWNEGSSRFSPMVASREKRKEFVRNALKFLRQNRFDGLDLDWEYPAFRDGGKPKDRENYARLVKELREEFDRESEKTGKPRLLLTMAVPAGIEYIQKGFDVKTLNQYLDWMNLLTYDYHSAFEPAVNHHAPLYPLEEPNEYSVDSELNIDYTIKFYLENGADRNKLVLGIPTYGRSYTLFNPDAIEIGSPADGPGEQGDATREKGYLAYYEICEALKPKERKRRLASEEYSDEESDDEEEPWTVMHPNAQAMGPVAFKGNQWVGYDDVEIVKKKAEYVVENGLGGIMFWSIDNDDFRGNCHGKPYPLIEAAKESYIQKLGSSDNTVVTDRPSGSKSGGRRRNRPKATSTTTTTTPKPSTAAKSNKRKSAAASTTPVWNFITPEPPTTPDPGSDFKCVDEGFYPHPRDCKKYFWCLDSGPSNLGIVAHQFTCPSGLYFNKAADSCDFSRNVLCKITTTTAKAPTTKTTATTSTTTTTTTRKPIKLSTRNSILFRTSTTTTTPEPETEEEYEDDVLEDSDDVDAEDPRVIKELIDLIKKVGGVEQLEKQLHLSESSASTNGGVTTAPVLSKKLYQKVLERTRGGNKFGSNSIIQSSSANSRRGPQNAGLEATADKDRLLKKDRPQYTTINRQRSSTTSTTQEPLDSDEIDDEEEEEEVKPVLQRSRTQVVESEVSVGTTAKPLQYVNIRRARPTTLATSDTADDTASRNALFERSEQPYLPLTDTPNSLDIASARRENVPEYVTIRRQRPTTVETTTVQYINSEPELRSQETALERELSTQPQYTSIVRGRSTTTPTPEEPSSPEPTTVLAVQISSFLNSPSSAEVESPEPETTLAQTTEATELTTASTTTTTTTPAPTTTASSLPTRRTILRRRGSTTTTTATPAASSSTQAAKRNFLRRTKATAPPDTTESDTATIENVDTTTNKFTKRGGSKFKNRKDVAKEAANDTGRIEKNEFENRTRRPYLNGGSRRSERPALTPTRTFARRKPGGANATTATPQLSSTLSPPSRRPFRVASRRRPIIGSTTTTTTTTTEATTTAINSEESLQDIGDTDFIEDPSLEPRTPKISPKIQRRPLITLKEDVKDQNPSATNEEERKRQSKKYSASIKQNQLDDLLRLKSKSQEDTTEYKTTVEEYSAETALAIAAHQLLTAPVPSIPDFEEETRPTRTQTTKEYKYTSPVTDYADSKIPYEYPSTTVYKPSTEQNYISTTANDFDDPTQFNSPKFSTTNYEPTQFNYPTTYETIEFNSRNRFRTTYDSTQFNSPKLPSTTYEPTEFNSRKRFRTTYDSTQFNSPKLPTTTYEPTELNSRKRFKTTYDSTQFNFPELSTTTYETTELNSPKLFTSSDEPTELNSSILSRTTYDSTQFNSPRLPTPFTPRTTYDSDFNDTPTEDSRTPPTPTYSKSSFGNDLTFSTLEYPTVNEYTNSPIEVNNISPTANLSPKSSVSKGSGFPDFKNDNDYIRTTDNAPRITSTKFLEPAPFSRGPVLSITDYTNLPTVYLPKISPTTNVARNPTSTFKTRQGFSSANVITSGLSAVSKNLGSRYQTSEKYIPVPVEGLEYSTVGYPSSTRQEPSSRSQEPSFFTREYLLESPVTKTYDDEYQYLSPVTTPKPSPRRIIRKKIQRKISTTIRPTTTFRPRLTTTYIPLTISNIAPVTTPKPRRIPSKKPFEKILKEDPPRTYRPIVNYDYYDDSEEKVAEKYIEGTKVVLHTKGAIECLDIGNFPHPTSCKKFISCARMESGALLGWEYICPKGLSFDPVGSICNWSAGLGCDEKDT